MMQAVFRFNHVNWALADQAMVSGVNFLTSVLVARFLGIEEFGLFSLIWVAVLFFSSFQMSIIVSPMMSIAPKQDDKNLSFYYGSVFAQQLIFSVLSVVSIVVGVEFGRYFFPEWNIGELLLPLVVVTFFFQLQDFLRRLFFVQGRQVAAFVNDAISYLMQLILLIYINTLGLLNTELVLWVIAITSLIAVFIGFIVCDKINISYDMFIDTAKRHWNVSKWLTGSALLQWLSGNLFIVVAASLLGVVAIGALKAAQSIMGITHILFQGLENIVPITASHYLHESGKRSMAGYLGKVTIWGGGATLVLALLVSAFPGHLLMVVFGDEYQDYGYVLRWYALIYLIAFIALPLRMGLRSMEKTYPLFIAYALMAFFSILSAKWLVQAFGLHGVLIGLLMTGVIFFATLSFFIKRIYNNYIEN